MYNRDYFASYEGYTLTLSEISWEEYLEEFLDTPKEWIEDLQEALTDFEVWMKIHPEEKDNFPIFRKMTEEAIKQKGAE